MIDIKLVLQNDPRDVTKPWQYVARAKSRGKYTFDMMADDISHSCSLTRADVAGCMEALIEKTVQHIMDGYTVDFRGLGSFVLKVDSRLATPEETQARGFRVGSMIKDYRLRFNPEIRIKRKIRELAEPRLLK
jgi:predicted histone-like DNA-binding protein